MTKIFRSLTLLFLTRVDGFTSVASTPVLSRLSGTTESTVESEELIAQKQKLFELLGKKEYIDPVLADPLTKDALKISTSGAVLGGERGNRSVNYNIISSSNKYVGTSDTFLDLLKPSLNEESREESNNEESSLTKVLQNFVPLIPPPLRSPLATAGFPVGDYVPMRDLFTSPAVSFAYERGWRQNFAAAGFPGPDKEAEMAMEYFSQPISQVNKASSVLVDMSCATGLFTRRFTKSGKYGRVLGCDYSDSMLTEARRRIVADSEISSQKTKLDLVRLDVGQIPMKNDSVDVLHAGAAMHCWPDLPAAVSEIHRVLKPGGRYFATTFLSSYFGTLQAAEGGNAGPSQQAFQYFESLDVLRSLMEEGGFESRNISVELLPPAAVVIRCEK